MAAITWQNINGPSLADAARPMESAQRSMAAAFGGLGDVLKQERDTQEANWNQGKINNKEAFLNTLYGAKSPEEMQALQKSGQLNTMLSGYGAQVADPGALRQAMEGRLGTLQQQALATGEYQDKATDNKDAPLRDNAASLYAQGKFAEGDAVTAQITRNKAVLFEAARAGQRRIVTEGQTDADAAQRRALEPIALKQANDNLLNGASTRELQAAQTARIPEDVRIQGQDANLRVLDKLNQMREHARESMTKVTGGAVGSEKGHAALIGELAKSIPDKGRAEATIRQISAAVNSDPRFAALPATAVHAIAMAHSKNTNDYTFSDFVPEMKADLLKALAGHSGTMLAAAAQKADITTQLKLLTGQIGSAEATAFPELGKQIAAAKEANDAKIAADKANIPVVGVAAPAGVNQPLVLPPQNGVTAPSSLYTPPPDSPAARSLASRAALAAANDQKVATRSKDLNTAVVAAMSSKDPFAAQKAQDMPGFFSLPVEQKAAIQRIVFSKELADTKKVK